MPEIRQGVRRESVAPTEVRVLASGQEVDLHVHDDAQLIYASTGVLEVMVQEGTWFTPSTRAVWVPGGTPHHWQVHGATTVHLVGMPHCTTGPAPDTTIGAAAGAAVGTSDGLDVPDVQEERPGHGAPSLV